MGNFRFDAGNYQNTGFLYPPSAPDDYFLDCPVHDCSSEDCGCIVYYDGDYERTEVPEDKFVECRCGEQIYELHNGWWHRIEDKDINDTQTCYDENHNPLEGLASPKAGL